MRTRIILSFIAALLMQFVSVRADNYSDGITKLINSDAMGSFNAKMFEQMSQIPNVNAGYINNQFKTDAVEWLAGHYRKNMSEKDFNDMVSFYMQPEVQAVQKKVLAAAASSQGQDAMQSIIMPQMQALMSGGTPEDLKEPDCDPQLKKEILHWMDINNSAEGMKASLILVKGFMADMAPEGVSADQMEMMAKMMDGMFSFMEKNMNTIVLTAMVGKVDLKDMQTLNAIEKKPFFASLKKTNASLAGDMSTFMHKVVVAMKKDMVK